MTSVTHNGQTLQHPLRPTLFSYCKLRFLDLNPSTITLYSSSTICCDALDLRTIVSSSFNIPIFSFADSSLSSRLSARSVEFFNRFRAWRSCCLAAATSPLTLSLICSSRVIYSFNCSSFVNALSICTCIRFRLRCFSSTMRDVVDERSSSSRRLRHCSDCSDSFLEVLSSCFLIQEIFLSWATFIKFIDASYSWSRFSSCLTWIALSFLTRLAARSFWQLSFLPLYHTSPVPYLSYPLPMPTTDVHPPLIDQ